MNGKLLALLCLVTGVACEEHIVLGMGCFFKAKKTFEEANESGKLKLEKIELGYAGGFSKKPDYLSVMRGRTGHAEVVRLTYNEKEQPLKGVLSEFWHGHDPTSQHVQGDEVGSQYRSIILYETDAQNTTAFESLAAFIAESDVIEGKVKIRTEVLPLDTFWPAEANLSIIAPEVQKIIKKEHDEFLQKIRTKKEQDDELTGNLDPNGDKRKTAEAIRKIKAKAVQKNVKTDEKAMSSEGEEDTSGSGSASASSSDETGEKDTAHDDKSDSSAKDDSGSKSEDNRESNKESSKESEEDKEI